MAGRVTEIDSLQGEIVRLGKQYGRPAPICARVQALIEQKPDVSLSPDQIIP
jgi:2-dehydropantoate 2-reductase